MNGEDASVVSYSVRELFERVDTKLTDIAHKLDSKADQSDLDALKLEVAGLRLDKAKFLGVCFGIAVGAGGGAAATLRAVLGG